MRDIKEQQRKVKVQESIERLKQPFKINGDVSGLELKKMIFDRIKYVMGIDKFDSTIFENSKNLFQYFSNMERVTSFFNSLPLEIKKAIEIYMSDTFCHINNEFLRKNKGLIRGTGEVVEQFNFNTWESKKFYKEGIVDSLDLLLSLSTIDKDMILFRGCTIEEFKDLGITDISQLNVLNGQNKTFRNYGYTSTSAIFGGQFIDYSQIVMVTRVPRGSNLCFLDPFEQAINGEMEVLLGRDTEFLISGVEVIGNRTFVYSEAVVKKRNVKSLKDIKISDNREDLAIVPLYPEEDSIGDLSIKNR